MKVSNKPISIANITFPVKTRAAKKVIIVAITLQLIAFKKLLNFVSVISYPFIQELHYTPQG
jgi:hypothetical protein